jgi:thiol-disulfide isomerase/thioredoxin
MKKVHNKKELDNFILKNRNKIILIYFGAVWCGPCKKLKEKLNDQNEMKRFEKLVSVYIDIDIEDLEEITNYYKVQSIPAVFFTLLMDNKVTTISNMVGYNWEKVISMYNDSLKYLNDELSNDEESDEQGDELSSGESDSDGDSFNDSDIIDDKKID